MRSATSIGTSNVRRAALETLENRQLMAAVTFDIDPNLSSLTVSGSVSALGTSAQLQPQSTGSLTAKIDGSIKTDLTATGIKFLAGSVYDAVAKPGPFAPTNGPGDFAGEGSLNLGFFSATLDALVSNFKFDTTSGVLALSGTGFASSTVSANVTGGTLAYAVPGLVSLSSVNLTGSAATNTGAPAGSVVNTNSTTKTLTLPIRTSYVYALSAGTATLRFTGTIVGKFVTTPQPTGSISGAVYNDLNDNGARDAGEVGLSAVTVYLDKNNNNILDTGDVSKVTDGSGNYSFLNLPAGAYTVRQIVKPGFRQTSPTGGEYAVTVGTGAILAKTFGNTQKAVIAGQKFNDVNDNGIKDAGEVGLSGWVIYLDKNNNNVFDTGDISQVTDSIGQFIFRNVTPGTYAVREVGKTGWRQTTPLANGGEFAVTLGNAQGITTLAFGNTQKTRISGNVYNDANDSGAKDTGEVGLSGWQVYLDKNNNNVFDAGDVAQTTDASGNYLFTNLTAGAYTVRETVKAGFRQTSPSGSEYAVTTALGQAVTSKNFGNTQKTRISGNVFNDANDNGIKDAGELGLSGWQVYLDKNNNNVFDTGDVAKTTDASGNYLFTNLTAGAYTVRETVKAGFRQTSPSGGEYAVTTALGQAVTSKNFGNTQKVRIGGIVFADQNKNGVKESTELGVASVRVFLDANNDGIFQSTEKSVLTSSTGAYSFTNLTAGTFHVRVVIPAGRTLTTPTGGAHNFTLAVGQATTSKYFGLFSNVKA